jgi:predicted dehydrogenase
MTARPLRYALLGLGHRATTSYLPVFASPETPHRLCAVMDADTERLRKHAASWHHPIATFGEGDLERLLRDTAPDCIIIASPDYAHHRQILAGLQAGASVVVEKPMVVDAHQARDVLVASRGAPGKLRVAHNLRYMNLNQQINSLLVRGVIGRVSGVIFEAHLSAGHGGSYFRRWHRRRVASGGLAVTKSCHHFDLINWWLGEAPREIFGWMGTNHFHPGGEMPGHSGERVPLDADIDDTLAAMLKYPNGVFVSYTLAGCSSWEGYRVMVQGARGTLLATYDKLSSAAHPLVVRTLDGEETTTLVDREGGRHAGADARMMRDLFGGPGEREQLLANPREGAVAVAMGSALQLSSERHRPIHIGELLPSASRTTIPFEAPQEARPARRAALATWRDSA